MQVPASPGHWEFIRHWTHAFVVVSHWGVNLVTVQLAEVKHWTQRMVVVLQTPPPPAAVHGVVVEHVRAHVYVFVSQAKPIPQLLLPRHATHRPAGEQYGGNRPPHWASMVHWMHICVVVLQVSGAVQFGVPRHWTHCPAVVSQ